MKRVKSIEEWRNNVDKMSFDIINWANTINSGSSVKKTALIPMLIIGGLGGVFYLLGFIAFARVCFILVALQLISNIFKLISDRFKQWKKKSFVERFK